MSYRGRGERAQKEKIMAENCRHVLPNGAQCHGYALRDGHFCFFHSRARQAARKPAGSVDAIDVPLLEDRCAIQVTLTQVLRAIVANTIDRPRASLLLYGLQLASQNVDHNKWAIPYDTVEAVSRTRDGDLLARDPWDDDEDGEDLEEDEDEEDEDASGDGSDGEEAGSDNEEESAGDAADSASNEDSGGDDKEEDEDDSGEDEDEDDAEDDDEDADDEDDGDDGLDDMTTEQLIAAHKFVHMVSEVCNSGDMRLAKRLLDVSH